MPPRRILIIEDDSANRENLLEFLALEGFEVRGCETGEEGIKLAQQFQPHLIICDYLLPGVSGEEVFWELKGRAEFLFYTAMADKRLVGKLSTLGAVVVKPASFCKLTRVINFLVPTIRE